MTMIGVGPKMERLLRAPGPCALIWIEGTPTGTNFMRPDHPKAHGQEDWKKHRPERGRHLPFRFKESGQVIFPCAHLSFSSCGQLLGLIVRIRYDFCNDQRRRSLALEHQYLIFFFFFFTNLWSQSFSKCRREGSRRVVDSCWERTATTWKNSCHILTCSGPFEACGIHAPPYVADDPGK